MWYAYTRRASVDAWVIIGNYETLDMAELEVRTVVNGMGMRCLTYWTQGGNALYHFRCGDTNDHVYGMIAASSYFDNKVEFVIRSYTPALWDFSLEYLHYCQGIPGDSSIMLFEHWMGEQLRDTRLKLKEQETRETRLPQLRALQMIRQMATAVLSDADISSDRRMIENIRDIAALALLVE